MRYAALILWVIVVALILARVLLLHIQGIHSLKFGQQDKRDFWIIPFALIYMYVIVSSAFNLPQMGTVLFHSHFAGDLGMILGVVEILVLAWSLISAGQSFRVGIDGNNPGKLITTGIFAYSRNPMYTALDGVLVSVFLMVPNWILLVFIALGWWMYNRQILQEEQSLQKIYGDQYLKYCKTVPRYL